MAPIDYPFYFDGVVYFGGLAEAYNQTSVWRGIHSIWSIHGEDTSQPFSTSGPIYLTLQLLFLKIFGFSYLNALWVQAGVLVGLVALIFWLIQKQVRSSTKIPFPVLIFSLLILWAVTSTGVLSVLPGNVFDFRVDLVGSLLLTLALTALPLRNWITGLTLAVAIHERFHNLSILVLTVGLLTVCEMGNELTHRGKPWQLLWTNVRYPLCGLTGLLLLRWSHMAVQFEHYREGYFGSEIAQRGFTWGGKDFFLFYPRAFLNQYVNPGYWWPLFGIVVFVMIYRQFFSAQYKNALPNSRVVWALFTGAVSAYLLLNINLTRNNIGVLRFVIVPALFGMVLVMADLWTEVSVSKRSLKVSLELFAAFVFFSCRAEIDRLKNFDQYFDYLGFRRHHMVEEINPIFSKIYESARAHSAQSIRVGAAFYSDYNLNSLQWNIFLASHNLPFIFYEDLVGAKLLSVKDFQKDQIDLLPTLDYLIMGPIECGTSEAPSNRQLSQHQKDLTSFADNFCKERLGIVTLDSPCLIQVRQCDVRGG